MSPYDSAERPARSYIGYTGEHVQSLCVVSVSYLLVTLYYITV